MQEELHVSVFFNGVKCLDWDKHFHIFDAGLVQGKEGVGHVLILDEKILLRDCFDPHDDLFEVYLFCLHPISEEGGVGFRLIVFIGLCCDQVEVVFIVALLKHQIVPVQNLELITGHEALEVGILLVPM